MRVTNSNERELVQVDLQRERELVLDKLVQEGLTGEERVELILQERRLREEIQSKNPVYIARNTRKRWRKTYMIGGELFAN